ncbi:prolyl oligopeptidase family serine peptidase [Gemmata sp. G18]|uniref:Prolyl oligopeptidase family serine peptidase n=1 Tax=Gemmata palustris TaxID=2822762 RepID=A0ABS5BZ09_9BACT|nr:prolyl oligopeptidase family serine peptidase [Gemmata palustris]MBP3958956.1 prolyl oligopeptidase family serine peptidase [Gemmata palustris]
MNRRDLFRVSALSALAGEFHPALARSADPPPGADEMIRKYLTTETKRISAKFMDGATTKSEWEKIRPRLKREFLDMLGLDPLPEKTPLKATVTGTLERGDVAIEKLHYQSKPGLYVTANLYRPKSANPDRKDGGGTKFPAILYVCGHSGRGRDGNKTAFQDHGMWFASNGYVCLVVDTLQLGEIAGKHHGTYNLNRFWWHSRGYTPAGVECWNGIRGIDYLCSLPFVDAEKIGVTGISGGGATTNWVAAADDRVKVAVPVSGVSDLECYVTDQVINGHCDCMFFHNLYQWEWTTALALFAPKPLLFANSDDDKIFPMTGNKRIIERLRKCYALFGAKDNVDEHVSKGGHDYRPDLRVAIFEFFHKHLKGDKTPVKDADFRKIEGKELRAFAEDKDIPKDAINATADETFVPAAKVALPTEKNFKDWKADLMKQLRAKVFRTLPEKIPAAKLTRPMLSRSGFTAEAGIEFETNEAQVERGGFPPVPGPPPVLAVLNAGDVEVEMKKWVERFGKNVLALSPRGVGVTAWSTKNPPNTSERSFALLGQTADSGRVRDVAGYLAQCEEKDGKVRLAGRGPAGVIAVYAALFVPGKVSELILVDPPISHRDGPYFLNVMRVLDIPEALGLLAPEVKLTLVNERAKDKAFDRTAAIFAAADVKDKFKRE